METSSSFKMVLVVMALSMVSWTSTEATLCYRGQSKGEPVSGILETLPEADLNVENIRSLHSHSEGFYLFNFVDSYGLDYLMLFQDKPGPSPGVLKELAQVFVVGKRYEVLPGISLDPNDAIRPHSFGKDDVTEVRLRGWGHVDGVNIVFDHSADDLTSVPHAFLHFNVVPVFNGVSMPTYVFDANGSFQSLDTSEILVSTC